jgi:hypothetical protein
MFRNLRRVAPQLNRLDGIIVGLDLLESVTPAAVGLETGGVYQRGRTRVESAGVLRLKVQPELALDCFRAPGMRCAACSRMHALQQRRSQQGRRRRSYKHCAHHVQIAPISRGSVAGCTEGLRVLRRSRPESDSHDTRRPVDLKDALRLYQEVARCPHCCPLIPIRRLKCEVQVFIYHREEP